jgi:hypothetical protein
MFGSAGRKRLGQSADVESRSLRTGAARRARVLTATLLVLAGPIASLWIGVSPAAATGTPGIIVQSSATSGTTTTTGWSTAGGSLTTTGQTGTVTFVTTSLACGVVVSPSSGAISTTGSPHVGSCLVSGTDSDSGTGSDSGTWTYTLTITAVTITQSAPTTGTTTTSGSWAFTDQLVTTGQNGTVTFVPVSNPHCGVAVSSLGAITTTGGLHAGTSCTVSGTDSDPAGDSGAWSYLLTVTLVTIAQSAPVTGTTTTTASSAFTGQLVTTGQNGTVTFVTGSTLCGGVVSSSGAITTTGSLGAGSCTVSGTDSDPAGDTGTWTYILTINSIPVTPTPTPSTTITQGAPMTGWTTPAASAAFKAHLATTGQGSSVSFVTTSWACWIDVSSSGAITATRSLKAGHCTVRGTDSDAAGDTGTWTYTLNIGPVTITQRAPMTGWTTRAASARFKGHLAMNGRHGHVWFVTTSRSCGVAVSPSGAITTKGRLKAGHCTVWGTDTGSARTWGRWTFTLTVRR